MSLVQDLDAAMEIRRLRNSCSAYLTNDQSQINPEQQREWFVKYYSKAVSTGLYRVYLGYKQDTPIGYGALRLSDGKLLVTECVDPEYRGQGYGTLILKKLMEIASMEKRELVAEIWADNRHSVYLHERAGFEFHTSDMKYGAQVLTYVLPANSSCK